ncbi:hypothetical protein H4R18_005175 [Coemansia javaensis]|uniref:Peptidase S1 domain-containing protein n=1 Tax=Coemansia javaensis TaxID=2761396 RepID=A0A9W8HA10_9FUNG|nr:hypothetical protein H4R18_005175 [Coemansia javaensis]
MKSAVLFGLAALAAAAARPGGPADPVPRIVGGRLADGDEFRSAAFIWMLNAADPGGYVCTGSLIAPGAVLTSAYCLHRNGTATYAASEITVKLNHTAPDLSEEKVAGGLAVSRTVIHPGFNATTLANDIALLILGKPADDVAPIKIYDGSYTAGMPVRAAGFGITKATDPNSLAPQLLVVDMAVGPASLCKKASPGYNPKTQICTDGTESKATCLGDNGGPLATPNGSGYALLAVTSHGPGDAGDAGSACGAKGTTGIYTYVAPYLSWIAKNANLKTSDISETPIPVPDGDGGSSSTSSTESSDDGGGSSESGAATVVHTGLATAAGAAVIAAALLL